MASANSVLTTPVLQHCSEPVYQHLPWAKHTQRMGPMKVECSKHVKICFLCYNDKAFSCVQQLKGKYLFAISLFSTHN